MEQAQGHQILNDNVNPVQDYIHAKFEQCSLNGVQEKANVKVFYETLCQLSPLKMCVCKKKKRKKISLRST